MHAIRVLFAAILFVIVGFATPVGATSATTDQSDLWWVSTEPGWGVQLVQRGTVIFATMFVYGPTGTPIWYTATLSYSGNFVWTGDLLLTNGPRFGTAPFNPDAVGYRKVGTMTWTATTTTTGTLTYSVDEVPVTKFATRQLMVHDDFSGRYFGGVHTDTTGCQNPAENGTFEGPATLDITQSGQLITLVVSGTGGSCTFTGQLTQAGQMGAVNGTAVCTNGNAVLFDVFEMQVNISGITGRLTTTGTSANLQGCRDTGWFGAMRATTF